MKGGQIAPVKGIWRVMELVSGQYYHICNRTNNEEALFRTEENYIFFLKKYRYYLDDFFETIAYCLMPTHFHFLVRVKPKFDLSPVDLTNTSHLMSKSEETGLSSADERLSGVHGTNSSDDCESSDERRYGAYGLKSTGERRAVDQIAILLRSYTRAFNKMYNRHGSLFQPRTKAININDEKYLLSLLVYIHQNPIRSGLVSKAEDWHYSSYLDYLEIRKGSLPSKQLVASYYKTVEEFKKFSEEQIPLTR